MCSAGSATISALVALTCGREPGGVRTRRWRSGGRPTPALRCTGQDERWPCGPEVLVEAATHPDVDIVVNAVVGAAGLDATLAALRAGKRVALANKETPGHGRRPGGAGGLRRRRRDRAGRLGAQRGAPVRHRAGQRAGPPDPHRSGGPFREWPAERVAQATVEEALRHPTWRMGQKITVDSATLANKALELIEAHYLFRLPYDALEVVVHPQSIVHAFVEFCDGSVMAQLGFPSMELPILYALTHPARLPDTGRAPVRSGRGGAAHLRAGPDRMCSGRSMRAWPRAGPAGTAPAVFNAANEVAVAAFLDGRDRRSAGSARSSSGCWRPTTPRPPPASRWSVRRRPLGPCAGPATW